MKLHYITLVSLMLGSLNLMAAEQEQPSTPTHRRSSTEVARTAFADETAKLQLEGDVNMYVDNGDENSLNLLLEKHRKNKSLEAIVAAGIKRCKKGDAGKDAAEKDLKPAISQAPQTLEKSAPLQPSPSSHASDARTMRPWIAGGLAAGIAIVVAVVCYFKWIKPAAAAH
jgi:hypothetical protein